MPVGKGSLQRAQSAAAPESTPVAKEAAATPVAKKAPVKKATTRKAPAKKAAPRKPAAVKTSVIAGPIDPEIASNIYCELPTYLL